MKICIVHDSQKGNGKNLAEKLEAEFTKRGAQVTVAHRSELRPQQVAESPPDLLIVGTAVRAFVTSPPTKQWINRLGADLNRRGASISHAAVFLTHAMPDAMVKGRVERLQRSISNITGIREVYADWLSGQVKDIPGPFVDGVMEKIAPFAAQVFDWAQEKH